MPHDLSHLIVELELGVAHGIFGQLQAGGHAATFHLTSNVTADHRTAARDRRRRDKSGEKLLREGRDDSALSERATYICLRAWLARSDDPALKARARGMSGEAAHVSDV